MFLLSLLLLLNVLDDVAGVHAECCCLLYSLLNFGTPTADDIHDDALVPAAAITSDFNSIPAFCCHPYCDSSPVVAFIPAEVKIMILLSSLLLIVAGVTVVACGVTAVACIQTVAGIFAVAGVLLLPDGLLLLVSLVWHSWCCWLF
jgi:hypothetical protein